MKTTKIVALLLAMLSTATPGLASSISPGDIAFIGYNTDDPDGFTFLVIEDLPGNTLLKFTDSNFDWFAPGQFMIYTGSESILDWTTPAGGVPCGSIIEVVETAPDVFSVTTGSIELFGNSWDLVDGDQVYAYQGDLEGQINSLDWIAAIHGDYDSTAYDTTTHWSPTGSVFATTPISTTLGINPFTTLGLTNYGTALFQGTPEIDNAHYSGPLAGDKAAIHAATQNPSNWTFNDSTAMSNGPADYGVVAISTCCSVSIDSLGNESCIGSSDGHLAVSATGGSGAYTYSWSNGATSATTSNLAPGLYVLTVTNSTCSGTGSATIASACKAPANLRPIAVQDTYVTLDWDTVCSSPSYKVLYRQAGTAAWSVAGFSQNNRHTVTGLTANTVYYFSVRAKCSANTWSAIADKQRAETLTQFCSTPSGLSTSPVQADQARLNWSTVSGAVKYRIRYRPTGTSGWTTATVSASHTKLWLTNLAAAQAYEWQMKAVCQHGASAGTAWTAVQTFSTASSQKQARIGSTVAAQLTEDLVFPNPSATGNFVLQPGITDETATFRIVDISGREVLQGRLNGTQAVALDLSAKPAGVYMLMIQGNAGTRVHKLIKQ